MRCMRRSARLPDGRGRRPLRRLLRRQPRGCSRSSGPSGSATRRCPKSAFVGAGIGAALGGMRPIVEIMTVNFSLLALDQIVNNAATLRHMSGGQFSVPLVIRMATGAGRQLAAQHSHSLEGWYAHIPGIKVAGAGHARGCARHALAGARGPRPGAHLRARRALQHGRRAGRRRGRRSTSIARAVRRAGDDVTLIAYGGTLGKTLRGRRGARRRRASRPRSSTCARCGRSTTHDPRVGDAHPPRRRRRRGLAQRQPRRRDQRPHHGEAFYDLDAPVARVCSAEVPMPYAKHLEDAALPQVRSDRRSGAKSDGRRWLSSACRRSAPTWRPARSSSGSSSPATRSSAATSSPWSRPRKPPSKWRSSRPASSSARGPGRREGPGGYGARRSSRPEGEAADHGTSREGAAVQPPVTSPRATTRRQSASRTSKARRAAAREVRLTRGDVSPWRASRRGPAAWTRRRDRDGSARARSWPTSSVPPPRRAHRRTPRDPRRRRRHPRQSTPHGAPLAPPTARRRCAAQSRRDGTFEAQIPHYYLGTHIDLGPSPGVDGGGKPGTDVDRAADPSALLLKAVGLRRP